MKKILLLLLLVLMLFSCKKGKVKKNNNEKGFAVAGVLPAGITVDNILGLIPDDRGALYFCAAYTKAGNPFSHFFKIGNSDETWQQLGALQPFNNVYSLSVDDAGNFYFADDRAHKWSGGSWSIIESAVPDPFLGSSTLGINIAVSPAADLFAMFERDSIGYYRYQYVRWNGTKWVWIGAPPEDDITSNSAREMICGSDGTLYVGSYYLNPKHWVYQYNGGNSWTRLGSANIQLLTFVSGLVKDKADNLYTTGWNSSGYTDTLRGDFIARWSGAAWSTIPYPDMGGPQTLYSNYIYALTVDPAGNLYAAGSLMNTAGEYVIAKWDGVSWSELGAGFSPLKANGAIYHLKSDGEGNIYAGGDFTDSSGNAYIVKYSTGN